MQNGEPSTTYKHINDSTGEILGREDKTRVNLAVHPDQRMLPQKNIKK